MLLKCVTCGSSREVSDRLRRVKKYNIPCHCGGKLIRETRPCGGDLWVPKRQGHPGQWACDTCGDEKCLGVEGWWWAQEAAVDLLAVQLKTKKRRRR